MPRLAAEVLKEKDCVACHQTRKLLKNQKPASKVVAPERLLIKLGKNGYGVVMKKVVFVLVACFLVLFFSTLTVHASQTFTLEPNNKQILSLNLNQGDYVNGTVTVSGGDSNEIKLEVADPKGTDVLSYYYTACANFNFSANTTGTYQLTLDNPFCSCNTAKNVTIDYSINSAYVVVTSTNTPIDSAQENTPNNGFPIALVLGAVAVAVAVVVAAAVYMLRLKPRVNAAGIIT